MATAGAGLPSGPERWTGSAATVEAVGLGYRYPSGRTGVAEVTLTVTPGERVVLMGPNGSGKSSLLRLVAGELRPSRGELSVLGGPPGAMDAASRRATGVAGDRPVHLDALTGRENALVFARAAGLDAPTASNRVDTLLGRFELARVAEVPVSEYSHGMRRKLLLLEALAHEPELLLLDEPTLGLDPPAVDALVAIVGAAAERRGASVLVATNDVAVAPRLADRIVFLHEGRSGAEGTPDELLARAGVGGTTVEVALAPLPSGPGGPRRARDGDVARCVHEALPEAAVQPTPNGLVVTLDGGTADVPVLVKALVDAGARMKSLEIREPHLGDVFRSLTGRELTAGPDSREEAP